MCLNERLEMIKRSINDSKNRGYDLSKEFSNEEKTNEEYITQEHLRLDTRSLSSDYFCDITLTDSALGLSKNEKILNTLEEVKNLFGTNPFHHVIEGRIAEIVLTELGIYNKYLDNVFPENYKKAEVPKEFQHYKDYKFEPWNNPHLNYSSIEDIIKQNVEECIPPDYNGRYADLVSK